MKEEQETKDGQLVAEKAKIEKYVQSNATDKQNLTRLLNFSQNAEKQIREMAEADIEKEEEIKSLKTQNSEAKIKNEGAEK